MSHAAHSYAMCLTVHSFFSVCVSAVLFFMCRWQKINGELMVQMLV